MEGINRSKGSMNEFYSETVIEESKLYLESTWNKRIKSLGN